MGRILKVARGVYYRAYIRWLAAQWMFQINLGDEVWHHGRKRFVSNGVCPGSWTLTNPYEEYVPRSEVTKHWTIKNLFRSYQSGVRFYTGCWLSIWTDKGIEPWVRACRIWPGQNP